MAIISGTFGIDVRADGADYHLRPRRRRRDRRPATATTSSTARTATTPSTAATARQRHGGERQRHDLTAATRRRDTRSLGERGDDVMLGGSGSDILSGGSGNDTPLRRKRQRQAIEGGDRRRPHRRRHRRRLLYGGGGNDTLARRPGNDRLAGGGGARQLRLRTAGNDRIIDFDPRQRLARRHAPSTSTLRGRSSRPPPTRATACCFDLGGRRADALRRRRSCDLDGQRLPGLTRRAVRRRTSCCAAPATCRLDRPLPPRRSAGRATSWGSAP